MSKKKPKMTIMLIVINIAMYLLMTVAGGSTNLNILIEFGAKDNALIAAGQFWRLFTPMFLHIGFQHIVLNMVTLYFLGMQIEYLFGPWRFLVIYLVSGICGNIASFAFTPAISAGASTALFGLFGAYLMLGESFRNDPYIRTIAKQFLVLVVLNLLSDLTGSIDLWGHLGGLMGGFLLGYIVGAPQIGKVETHKRWLALVGLVLLFAAIFVRGIHTATA